MGAALIIVRIPSPVTTILLTTNYARHGYALDLLGYGFSLRWIQADSFRAKTICNVFSSFATKSPVQKKENNRILRVFDGLLLATDQF